uniref:OmpA-like transmembrane domain-containing protein n=1 Tax=uncultured Thiotrichaceae bacterium TaxID=298394 RepID=A0A6S6UKL4_9GAMM|nr:MAG: OmpA-like transmembrane domain-containing protein [uncultured Thiotrichaceae bacterium]
MKKKLRWAAFAILVTTSFSTAQAANLFGMDTSPLESDVGFDNGLKLYTGGSLIYSTQDSSCETPFFEGSCDAAAVNAKIFGGARFNPMFGVEVAYVSQNEAAMKGTAGNQTVSSNNKVSGYQVSGMGYLPVTSIPELELMGKAGVMFWERETDIMQADVKKTSADDGVAPMVGLGAQYQLNNNIHLRTEWEHIFNTGSDSNYETDVDNYSVGLSYSTL